MQIFFLSTQKSCEQTGMCVCVWVYVQLEPVFQELDCNT